jgi:hypothetical protein
VLPIHCRPTHCFKSTAAQGGGYSGTSGLVLGLSSITIRRGELVSLLRRYFNTLYPLASTLLRNLVQSYPGCTLIPSDKSHSFKHISSHTFPVTSPHAHATHIPLGRTTSTSPACPVAVQHNWLSPTPALAPGLCSAQPFISERRSFAVSSTQILLDVPRTPTTR